MYYIVFSFQCSGSYAIRCTRKAIFKKCKFPNSAEEVFGVTEFLKISLVPLMWWFKDGLFRDTDCKVGHTLESSLEFPSRWI